MGRDDYSKYLDTLELSPGASLSEIRKAYLHLRLLYARDSIVTLPVKDEISEERKKEILDEIEEAYHGLHVLFEQGHVATDYERGPRFETKDLTQASREVGNFSGQTLRVIRKKLNIELQDIALSTKIQIQYLENIENEKFDALPPLAYIRGFVVSYAEYLGLDSKKVAEDYMSRYHVWRGGNEKKT